ncbi:hypothetical protein Agub_g12661, partial [Astrephomene gubernaculifera]
LMAAAGAAAAPRARGVVHLETAGLRGGAAAKAPPLPPLVPVLHMRQVVRQVVQLGMEVLLPGYGSGGGGSSSSSASAAGGGGFSAALTASHSALRRLSVPVSFINLQHYTDVFRALLIEELAAAVRSSVEDLAAGGGNSSSGGGGAGGGGGGPPAIRALVSSLQRTDDVHSVTLTVEGGPAQRDMCRPEDLVLLTRRPLPGAASLARPSAPCVLGVVTEVAQEGAGGPGGLLGGCCVTVQVCLNPPSTAPGPLLLDATAPAGSGGGVRLEGCLLPRTEWHLTSLHSLVPHFREFAALCNLPRLHEPTVRFLLNPQGHQQQQQQQAPQHRPSSSTSEASAPPCWEAAALPPPLKAALHAAFNEGQRGAILAALDTARQFTLVQGPPGTGKTSAIMGMVSVLLARPDIAQYKAALEAGEPTKYDRGAGGGADAGGGGGRVGGRAAAAAGRGSRLAASGGGNVGGGGGMTKGGPLKKSSAAKRYEAAKAAAAAATAGTKAAKAGGKGTTAAEAAGSGEEGTAAAAAKEAGNGGGGGGSDGGGGRDPYAPPPAKQPRWGPSPATTATAKATATGSGGGGASSSSLTTTKAASSSPTPPPSSATTAPQAALDAFDFAVQPRCRVLVCAQSNAAIDELLTRLAEEGVWRADGSRRPPAVVRLGRVEVAHGSVMALHVDSLAEQLAGRHTGSTAAGVALEEARKEVTDARKRFEEVSYDLEQLERKLATRQQKHKPKQQQQGDSSSVYKKEGQEEQQQEEGGRAPSRRCSDNGSTGSGAAAAAAAAAKKDQRPAKARARSKPREGADGGDDMDLCSGGSDGSGSDGSGSDGSDASLEEGEEEEGGGRRRKQQRRRRQSRAAGRDKAGAISVDNDGGGGGGRVKEAANGKAQAGDASGGDVDGDGDGEDEEDEVVLAARVAALQRQKQQLWERFKYTERTQRRGTREVERQRRERRQAVVLAAEVVVTTLSSSGGDLAQLWSAATHTAAAAAAAAAAAGGSNSNTAATGSAATAASASGSGTSGAGGGGLLLPAGAPRFDALIIDEAAQALEPAALIPLQLLQPGGKVILVGDPRQLPPTVLSRAAEAARLSQSLFERLQAAGCRVCLLARQYRMHPHISRFPSAYFYDDELRDGETITPASRAAPCHSHPLFGPLVLLDCREGRERAGGGGGSGRGSSSSGGGGGGGGSLRNLAEADLVAELYAGLTSRFPTYRPRIAILTPYRAQLATLRAALRSRGGVRDEDLASRIDIATVDGYQGREADVVIFSAVRAKPPAAVGGGGG